MINITRGGAPRSRSVHQPPVPVATDPESYFREMQHVEDGIASVNVQLRHQMTIVMSRLGALREGLSMLSAQQASSTVSHAGGAGGWPGAQSVPPAPLAPPWPASAGLTMLSAQQATYTNLHAGDAGCASWAGAPLSEGLAILPTQQGPLMDHYPHAGGADWAAAPPAAPSAPSAPPWSAPQQQQLMHMPMMCEGAVAVQEMPVVGVAPASSWPTPPQQQQVVVVPASEGAQPQGPTPVSAGVALLSLGRVVSSPAGYS